MKLLALLALAATLSAQTHDGNGALEAFYRAPKHHWYASKKLWTAVGAAGAGFAIGIAINSTRSAGSMYHSPMPTQFSASPQPVGVVGPVVNGPIYLGIGGPGIGVVKGGAN